MLFSQKQAHEKRAAFAAALKSGRLLTFPGAFAPIAAMEIETHGFDGVYISGAVMAADLGLPDIGLTTLTEVAQRGHQIARVTDLPSVIDADTGFGEPMSAARTIRTFEEMGIAGCHIEDQVNPKRCGHLDNKAVVDRETAAKRVKAAADAKRDKNFQVIARTDARSIEGLDSAIDRMKAYVDAGADMLFPEAMENEREFEAVRKALNVPLMANMTEFGKSKLFTTKQLSDLGYNMVIYPVTLLRLAMGAATRGLEAIKREGTQESVVPQMQSRARLYELLRYEAYNDFDQSLFNFRVPGVHK